MSTFCDSVNIDELDYKEPQNNKSGGKVVYVSTKKDSSDWKDKVRFQMSEDQTRNLQTAVWGLATPIAGQDASRRTLELTIESEVLLDFLNRLDENNIQMAVKNAPIWFKKNVDENHVRGMYVHLVKPPQKPDSKSTVRVKVKCGKDYPTNIYVVDNEDNASLSWHKGHPDDLAKNVKCMVMVETVGMWFMSRQFGMSLTATEIMVWPSKQERATGINAFTLTNSLMLTETLNDTEENNTDDKDDMLF